jgi:hypothetical protein
MAVDLLEQVGVPFTCSVSVALLFTRPLRSSVCFSVWMAISDEIASARLAAIRSAAAWTPASMDKKRDRTHASRAGAEIQDGVDDGPGDHDAEEAEHEGPGAHHVAHAVGGPLIHAQLIAGPYPWMFVPMGLLSARGHGRDRRTGQSAKWR